MGLQDHIHLSETLSGPVEYAPDIEWKIVARVPVPTVFMTIQRSLTGKLYRHILTNESGPVRLKNFTVIIKVQADDFYTLEDRVAMLEALNGSLAYYCDSFHADTGTDHTADVRPVLVSLGEFTAAGVLIPFYTVEVMLEDNSL